MDRFGFIVGVYRRGRERQVRGLSWTDSPGPGCLHRTAKRRGRVLLQQRTERTGVHRPAAVVPQAAVGD